ncbi:MAG: hypothetical protein IPF92_08655 [Myxococcales bacterium]|jgi:hypothetical protein|nr:hypothetical protein [Myxococcales bacterium]MBL0193193.1 hypothetical protein [Myxococcales bacterium]HQY64781.1 hypothetical protein [Polyangiaceae bacterium]
MGIDKIGKNTSGVTDVAGPDATSGADGAAGPGGAKGVERSFAEVHEARHSAAGTSVAVGGASSPLEQLRAGALDQRGYLEARVEQATSGLRGLSERQLEAIRVVLREQLATDPSFIDLVTQATGRAPPPATDE